MNKKVIIVALAFMFFVSTCASFASAVVAPLATPQEVAQHHRHHKHHGDREHKDYRHYKRVCPPTCRCIRDGFCRPGECSVKCRCHNCKVVPRHRPHGDRHHQHHHRY
jgi:hypothetical protein